jgi:hypothetical protein
MNIEIRPVKRDGKESLGPGLAMWRRVRCKWDWAELPYVFSWTASLDDGRMVVESFSLQRRPGGPPVTGEALRGVQVASFLRDAVWNAADLDPDASALMQSEPASITAAGKTDEALRAVSLAYRFAYLRGDAPRKAVMEMLGASRATASRWITAAVERGFLDAALARRVNDEEEA